VSTPVDRPAHRTGMSQRQKSRSLLALAGFGAATAVAAWYGAHYSPKNAKTGAWYARLDKPGFTPPDYVFSIVWTGLYGLMALSAWRVWRTKSSPRRRRALHLWRKQLVLNAGWSRVFFGKRRPDLALIDVIALESKIVRYIRTTYPLDRPAAYMFVPYAAWVGYAAVLNAEIARRNPHASRRLARTV
jgi:benzodiazapine receptor